MLRLGNGPDVADGRQTVSGLPDVPSFDGRPAIAVLPFENLSPDPEQAFFADGLAEDLITRLSVGVVQSQLVEAPRLEISGFLLMCALSFRPRQVAHE